MNHHTAEIISISYNEDKTKILTSSFDKTILEWDEKTGQLINSMQYINNNYPSACATKAIYSKIENEIFTASIDCKIIKWNIEKNIIIKEFIGHNEAVKDIILNNNKTMLISCCDDGTFKQWDTDTGELLKSIHGNDSIIDSVQYSLNEDRIFTASKDGSLKECDAETGNLISVKFDNIIPINQTLHNYNDKQINKLLKSVHIHNNIINSIQYSPNEDIIITAFDDGSLKEWNVETGSLISIKFCNIIPIKKVLYNYNGKQIFCQLEHNDIVIIDTEMNKIEKLKGVVWSAMDYDTANNMLFAVNGINGSIVQYDVSNHNIIRKYNGSAESFPTCINCAKDKIAVAYRDYTGTDNFTLKVWDTKTGELIIAF